MKSVVVKVRAVGHGQATRYSARNYKRTGTGGTGPGPAHASTGPGPGHAGPGPAHVPAIGRFTLAVGATVATVAAFTARWAWRQLERTEVSGDSMRPALQPGDRLLVWRTKAIKVGDIVAAVDPRLADRTVLKRTAAVRDNGVFLLGDNEARSTDSRHFGLVPLRLVRGKAVYRYAPPGRTGRL